MTRTTTFNPIDFGFNWTEPETDNPRDLGWYEFDQTQAAKDALKARNAEVKRLRKLGHRVTVSSLGKQLISRGGVGSNRPHVEFVVPVYALTDWGTA